MVEFPSLLLLDHLMSGWERMLVAVFFVSLAFDWSLLVVLLCFSGHSFKLMKEWAYLGHLLAKVEVRRCLAFCFWMKGYKRLCLNIVPPVLGSLTNVSFFSYFSEYHFDCLSHYFTWFTVVLVSSRVRDDRDR